MVNVCSNKIGNDEFYNYLNWVFDVEVRKFGYFDRKIVPKCTDSSVWSIVFAVFRFERCSSLLNGFCNKLIANASRWMLVENGIHQSNFRWTSPSLSFCWTILKNRINYLLILLKIRLKCFIDEIKNSKKKFDQIKIHSLQIDNKKISNQWISLPESYQNNCHPAK